MDGSSAIQASRLLSGFSVEITGKDASALADAAPILPPNTPVNITYLGNELPAERVRAAEIALMQGLRPVPHLSARRIVSTSEFTDNLSALKSVGASNDLFLVGGDPTVAEGPFQDALALIQTGLLPEYGVRHVGLAGYPEGHPGISENALEHSLVNKIMALEEQDVKASITTQFGFDAYPVLRWIADIRQKGIENPIRVGVPGPAGIKRLLKYARRFGVQSSAGIAQKYGFSITSLMGTAGPDRFIDELSRSLDAGAHGDVGIHFYTFGGVRTTAEWVRDNQLGLK